MPIVLALIAAVAGVLNTVQAGANATLNKVLEAPVVTALVIVAGNLIVYALASLVVGFALPTAGRAGQAPWWAWTGGLLGGLYVLSAIYLAQKLGAATFTGVTVTAGLVASVVLDHVGLVGFAQHGAGLGRIGGCVLMIGGLLLVCLT